MSNLIRSFGMGNNSVRLYNDGDMNLVVINEGMDNEEAFPCLSDDESSVKSLVSRYLTGMQVPIESCYVSYNVNYNLQTRLHLCTIIYLKL
jgi:hypothetical protein